MVKLTNEIQLTYGGLYITRQPDSDLFYRTKVSIDFKFLVLVFKYARAMQWSLLQGPMHPAKFLKLMIP